MKNVSIISVNANHDYYDPSASCTGGSYYQPHGDVIWDISGTELVISIDDKSCGGFGSRVFVSVDGDAFCFGSMDDACIDEAYADECCDRLSHRYGVDFNFIIASSLDAVRKCSICYD